MCSKVRTKLKKEKEILETGRERERERERERDNLTNFNCLWDESNIKVLEHFSK